MAVRATGLPKKVASHITGHKTVYVGPSTPSIPASRPGVHIRPTDPSKGDKYYPVNARQPKAEKLPGKGVPKASAAIKSLKSHTPPTKAQATRPKPKRPSIYGPHTKAQKTAARARIDDRTHGNPSSGGGNKKMHR